MSNLFISHSSRDNEAAQELKKRLEQKGHRSVFLDLDPEKGIQAGVSWERTLYTKLRSCRAVVALCSDNYLASQWCFAEIALARMEGKELFALQIEPWGKGAEFPSILTEDQYIDLRTDPEGGYERLWNGFEIKGIVPEEYRAWKPGDAPYPGLRAFDESDAPIFFGRGDEVREGVELLNRVRRLGHPRMVMVLGSSGSGKSSLARAGIVPQLRRDKERWVVVGPFRPGERPDRELALALSQAFTQAGKPRAWQTILDRLGAGFGLPDAAAPVAAAGEEVSARERLRRALLEMEEELTARDAGIARSVGRLKEYLEGAEDDPPGGDSDRAPVDTRTLPSRSAAAAVSGGPALAGLATELRLAYGSSEATVVLLIDQFEELLGHEEAGADHPANRFLRLLKEGIESEDAPPLALGTMRSDFLGMLQRSGPLRGVGFKSLSVGPMSEEGMKQVVERPALLGQIDLDEELTHRLLRETGTPDALPLLAFTLRAMWDRYHETRRFDVQGYEALGGLQGAIARVADDTLEVALAKSEDGTKKDLRIAFLSLARPAAEGTGWARQPASWDEMPERVRPMIQRFIDQRLLVKQADGTVEVAHEALFRSWKTLRGWLDANAEGLHLLREIRIDAEKWEKTTEEADKEPYLWRKGRLARALELRDRGVLKLTELDNSFIEASEREEQRKDAEEEARRKVELEQARELAEEQRKSAEKALELAEQQRLSARRTRIYLGVVGALLAGAVVLALFANTLKIAAFDQTRIAIASEWLLRDPTRAALLLLELERPRGSDWAVQIMSRAMAHPLPLAELPRHPDSVMTAFFSPEGQDRIVTASRDGVARVWSADGSGEPIELRDDSVIEASGEGPAPLTSADFSPDGLWIVTASEDRFARLWRADGSGVPRRLEGHSDIVTSAAFNQADGRIVTSSDDGDARLWNPDGSPVLIGGEPLRLPHEKQGEGGAKEEVNFAAFSVSGDRIVTASSLGGLRVWAGGDDRELLFADPEAHDQSILSAVFDPAGERIVTASRDRTARVWRVSEAGGELSLVEERKLEHPHEVLGAGFAPGGDGIVTASRDGARVWSLAHDKPLAEPLGEPLVLRHEGEVNWAAFDAAGERIVTASKDKGVRVWRPRWSGEPQVLSLPGMIAAAWGPAGGKALTALEDGLVLVHDTDPDRVFPGPAAPTAGEPAASDAEPSLWDSGEQIQVRFLEFPVLDIDVSPAGDRIVAASEDAVRFWDAGGQPVLETDDALSRSLGASATSARYGPGGDRIVTVSGNTAMVWEVHARETEPRIFEHPEAERVLSASISRDGETVLTVSEGPQAEEGLPGRRIARVWSAAESEPVVLDHARLLSADLDPSGNRIVTTSSDRIGRLWTSDGRSIERRLEDHEGPVIAASFSPDGERIVTGSEDGTARVWRVEPGSDPLVLPADEADVSEAFFSPDGDRVLAVSKETEARIWTVSYELLGARIRAATSACLDPRFRQQTLGETRDEANRKHLDCTVCRSSFDRERGQGTGLEEAFQSYRRCLRTGLLSRLTLPGL